MLISKKEALEKGLIYYYTGKPCKHGHITERLVKGGSCRICKNNYSEKYRNENVLQVKESIRRWQQKNYSTEKRRESYIRNFVTEMLTRAKYRAEKNNLEFNLTREDINLPEFCPVFGIKIDFENQHSSPALDRVDNEKGYIKGNVRIISNRANRLKNNGTIEEFQQIIEYMKNG
jgi:hypothetical protein